MSQTNSTLCHHPSCFSAPTALLKTQSRMTPLVATLLYKHHFKTGQKVYIFTLEIGFSAPQPTIVVTQHVINVISKYSNIVNTVWSETGFHFFMEVAMRLLSMKSYMYIDQHLMFQKSWIGTLRIWFYCMPSICSLWLK